MEKFHLFRERTPSERPLPVICCAVGIDSEKTVVTWHTKRAAWSLERTIFNSILLGHTMLAVWLGKGIDCSFGAISPSAAIGLWVRESHGGCRIQNML